MLLAQRLYEGVELGPEGAVGLITYMRTDSLHVADQAVGECRDFISRQFSKEYLPEKALFYKSSKAAQGAHEAIRPTSADTHARIRASPSSNRTSSGSTT